MACRQPVIPPAYDHIELSCVSRCFCRRCGYSNRSSTEHNDRADGYTVNTGPVVMKITKSYCAVSSRGKTTLAML